MTALLTAQRLLRGNLDNDAKKIMMEDSEGAREERQEFELRASDEAIEYLSAVTEEDWKGILLSESLMTTSSEDFGDFEISVNPGEWHDKECYVVHITDESIVNNVPRVTTIIAHVDQTFVTLEQSLHEYVQIPGKTIDKKTLIVLEGGMYTVQRTVTQEDFERRTHETYSVKQLRGFICEGCHVLVERLLVRKGVPDNMVFLTFDSEANLSKMTFKMVGEKEVAVGDECVLTVGMQCTVESMLEPEMVWESFFLPDGHLVSRTALGSDVTVKRMELPRSPTPETPQIITPLKWEEDMQLFSQFTDRKEELIDDHNTYIKRHPELKAILADFLQFLLLRKPDDIYEFARDFFGGMSLGPPNSDQ